MPKRHAATFKTFRCPPLSASRQQQIRQEANVACDELIRFSASEVFNETHTDRHSGHGSRRRGSRARRRGSSAAGISILGGSFHEDFDDDLTDSHHQGSALAWEYQEQLDSIRIDKVKVKGDHKKSLHYFRGSTQVEATLEQVLELYEVDVDHPNVQLENKLAPELLHSVVLYEIQPYNVHAHTMFIGIRWAAVRSPYPLVRNRDYCFLECQRRFTLADGRRGFARCHHSVKIRSCPEMEQSHGFVRASMYRSGLVFVESQRDRRMLEVVQATYTDLKGNVPQWVASMGIRAHMMGLEHLKKYLSMKRVASQSFARRSEMMARGKIKTCSVCVGDIGTFKRKYNCHKCGEVICSRCKHTMHADIPVVGRMKLTICSLCSMALNRKTHQDSSGSSGDQGRVLHDRPFSFTPSHQGDMSRRRDRQRARSADSFHTANFDQSTTRGSLLSAEV